MKIKYALTIKKPNAAKIQAIALIRGVTGMGLKEAMEVALAGDVDLSGERNLDQGGVYKLENARIFASVLRHEGAEVELAIHGMPEPPAPVKFDQDRFYAFRNAMRHAAEIQRISVTREFVSGPVSISAMSHEDGVSWACWFDGGRAFHGLGLLALEDLLVQAGEIWWG